MQPVNNLLNQAVATSSTPRLTKPSEPVQPEQLRGILKELVNMGLMNNSSDPAVVKVWTEGLVEFPYYALRAGLKKARDFQGYFNLPAMRELCRLTVQDLGLPDAYAAYLEAATHSSGHTWSHPAIYHAALETGFYELRTMTKHEAFPLFERNYEIVCRRILAGEDLSLPIQKALPEKVFVPASEEKAKATLGRLKDLLG